MEGMCHGKRYETDGFLSWKSAHYGIKSIAIVAYILRYKRTLNSCRPQRSKWILSVLQVWMHGHGQRPGTTFRGWTPSSHYFVQLSLNTVHSASLSKHNHIRDDIALMEWVTKFQPRAYKVGFYFRAIIIGNWGNVQWPRTASEKVNVSIAQNNKFSGVELHAIAKKSDVLERLYGNKTKTKMSIT